METKTRKTKKISAADFMPQDDNILRILRLRAKQFAKIKTEIKETKGTDTFVRFKLGNEEYGIAYTLAKEVIHHVTPARLPRIPDYVAGIINRRGALIAVLDLKKFFRTGGEGYSHDACIITVTGSNMTVGILVDNVIGSESCDIATLDTALPSNAISKPEYIQGIYKSRVTLINMNAILDDLQRMMMKKQGSR